MGLSKDKDTQNIKRYVGHKNAKGNMQTIIWKRYLVTKTLLYPMIYCSYIYLCKERVEFILYCIASYSVMGLSRQSGLVPLEF